jgi:nicotinamide mononucleotide (NMN) deamidase PncC
MIVIRIMRHLALSVSEVADQAGASASQAPSTAWLGLGLDEREAKELNDDQNQQQKRHADQRQHPQPGEPNA